MKKSKKPLPKVEIMSYGRYAKWDHDSRQLPELEELTTEVETAIGVEFGMIVEISQGKGRYLDFRIDHPPFLNASGQTEPSFEGSIPIRKNPYTFFLGDTIWSPINDKRGPWTMTVMIDEKILATKTINLI